jgi:uncharacterized protein
MKFVQGRAGNLACGMTLGLLMAGCDKPEPPAPAPRPPTAAPANPFLDRAQPKLQTLNLWLGSQVLETEIAATMTEVATGMMYRKEMPENTAMLFVFPRPHRTAFYMKNTVLPLSAAYIAGDGTILEIHDLKPLDETPVPANSDEVQFVLEVNQGWFERHRIPVGTLVRTQFGSLQESFFRRR